jgi:hypothetical protein
MHNNLNFKGATINLANTGLTAGTTSTYTTTATSNAVVAGRFTTALTAQTNTASPTTDVNTGVAFRSLTPNQATVLVWGLTTAGAIRVAQGSIESTATGVTTTVGAFINAPQFPTLPDDFCPIGYTLVRTAPSASTWTAGSSSWAASGVSATFVNVSTLPERPATA